MIPFKYTDFNFCNAVKAMLENGRKWFKTSNSTTSCKCGPKSTKDSSPGFATEVWDIIFENISLRDLARAQHVCRLWRYLVTIQVDLRAKAGFLAGDAILLLEISNKERSIMRLRKYMTLSGGANVRGYFIKQLTGLNNGGTALFDAVPPQRLGIPFPGLTSVGFAHVLYPDLNNPKYFFYKMYTLDGYTRAPEDRILTPRDSDTLNRLSFRAMGSIAASSVTLIQMLEWPGMLSTALALPVVNGNEFDLILKESRDDKERDLSSPRRVIELVPTNNR